MIDGKEHDPARRRAALLARQPTFWEAQPSRVSVESRGRRVLMAIRALTGVLTLSLVPPVLLVLAFGSPSRLVPSWDAVAAFLADAQRQSTPRIIAAAVAVALWLLWAIMMILLVGSLVRVIGQRRIPRWRLPAPLHRLLFGLAGTAVVAAATSPQATTYNLESISPTDMATTVAPAAGDSTVDQGTVTVLVGETRFEHQVKRGDTLSKIARRWLGDAERWPEICRLNRHQHQADGTKLTDCDLIYPGWHLRLPDDAKPPTNTTRTEPPRPRTPSPSTPTTRTIPEPSTPPESITSEPATSASATETASAASPSDGESATTTSDDDSGVHLSPGDWLPWTVAAAISAAAARVWLQRRRRYTGAPDEEPLTELPPPVTTIRRALAHQPEPSPETSQAPAPASVLTGGTGLLGDGAPAAARAALVAALASGDPDHPHARGEVIIDAATLDLLLGPEGRHLSTWPRLQVTDSIEAALTAVEARLLHRSRILDEHALTDIDELQHTAPDEQAVPPVVLITAPPSASSRMRAKAAIALGDGLRMSTLLLGDWADGPTIEVTTDGHVTVVAGRPDGPPPPRLALLEHATAVQILSTLREAQTGQPPTAIPQTRPIPVVALHRSRDSQTDTAPPHPIEPSTSTTVRAKLRVLGHPRIDDITKEGRPLRAKALELAVYLAVHPEGATTREIGEYLEPDARVNQADQRVHTNASNLRHVLSRAGTAEAKNAYVIKSAGRYRLDPATVDVDVWTLRDLMRKATVAAEPRRRELLTAACELFSAALAEGQDYEWIQPHRETVRRWGTEAHLMLADDLLDKDPQTASDLLDKAIGMDQYNEALYVKAMHARHALADTDGIRTLLRALTKALAELDAEPREDTLELANDLRTRLDSK